MDSIDVSVETPCESQIQEIAYDGQEIYQTPASMSENLAKLVDKIDFAKNKEEDEVVEENVYPSVAAVWPWDSVRNKLKGALTEMCVLSDVLNIVKEKRYLTLDPVSSDTPQEEKLPLYYIMRKKKALNDAGQLLIHQAHLLDISIQHAKSTNFHLELMQLRQNWKVKKLANNVIGDLSYKTAGSKFPQSGFFEVIKSEEEKTDEQPSSSLKVHVPSELEGIAYIEVVCQKDQEDLFTRITTNTSPHLNKTNVHWQQKLEAAQNVLFCKELFNHLAREAIHLNGPIPHMVISNQIIANVFSGIQMKIKLCHSLTDTNNGKPYKPEHNHVLEHSLHQLLREIQHKNANHPFPHPACGPMGTTLKRLVAGPRAADRYELIEMTKSKTILEQVIQQSQYYFMRLRTEYVLDTMAKEVKDPIIVSHWTTNNSPTEGGVRVNIITHGYESLFRTSLMFHVKEKTVKCICRDGKVIQMSYEPQELRDLLVCQINLHQINSVQSLAKVMGWNYLSSSTHLGMGHVEPLGNASGCLVTSPQGDRMIAVRCEPHSSIHVSIAQSPRTDFFPGQLVKEHKWEHLGGSFKEVYLDKMDGKTFLKKMELLMASLTCNT